MLPHRRGAEIDDEIRHHIEEAVDRLLAEGWGPEAARREAERRFGDALRIRRELYRVRRESVPERLGVLLRSVGGDLRYAGRGLAARPSFAAASIATLALGLGAAVAVFAVVDALLLRPLAYRDAQRWVEVVQVRDDGGYSRGLSADVLREWRGAADGIVDGWVAFVSAPVVRTDGDSPEALSGVAVTAGAERLLGIPLLFGRGFTGEDSRPGAPPVALLARAYWERTGADRDVLGRTLRTEAGPAVVVGVLDDGPRFPTYGGARDVWVPLRDDFTWADRGPTRAQGVWAHLADGVMLPAAQERMDVIAEALSAERSDVGPRRVALTEVRPFRGNPPLRRALWTLAATVAAILLIAVVNGVNLALVRASARGRELAVRVAIGGSRARLLRQFLVEGAVLGLLGGVAGALLAHGALAAARGILPSELVFFTPHAITVETRTIAFAAGASVVAGILLGLLPALQALRGQAPFLALGGRGDDGPSLRRLRHGLVAAQVALTMTLLVVAVLLTRSMAHLLAVDAGFEVARVAMADLVPSPTRYPDAPARAAFLRRLEEALEARPEIESVSIATGSGFSSGDELQAEGHPEPASRPTLIPFTVVGEDWFATVGAELIAGRALTGADAATNNVIVDRDMARLLWSDDAPLGRRFRIREGAEWMTVVGVVRELRLMGRDQREGPYQFLAARDADAVGSFMRVAMRTSGASEALLPVFRETLRSVDPEQWVWRLRTGAAALAEEEDTPRFLLTVMALLAGVATLLSAVGLHGVLAYVVGRRRRELGVRMALGADPRRVRRTVLREGLTVVAGGAALGALGALALSGTVGRLLYQMEPIDPVAYGVTVLLLLVVACVAAWSPAYRATRVDPVEVLRAE
ncbi:MAG TPA: ADOP family duplicated permease [Longimicrobiales bacterium]|nr:ADOP family duplicated permease [Longimicrobiales bacterium]